MKKPNGVLAVHISNRYLDLQPVLAAAALALHLDARMVETFEDDTSQIYASEWVLMTRNPAWLQRSLFRESVHPLALRTGFRHWTDDYSNLIEIMK